MPVVEISFDTYKHLTLRREDETVTYDDVVRDLLKLPRLGTTASAEPAKKGWTNKGSPSRTARNCAPITKATSTRLELITASGSRAERR